MRKASPRAAYTRISLHQHRMRVTLRYDECYLTAPSDGLLRRLGCDADAIDAAGLFGSGDLSQRRVWVGERDATRAGHLL